MIYYRVIYTAQKIKLIENNPDLLEVCLGGGRLWISEDARDDIATYTGQCPDTEDVREMLKFLSQQCEKLKYDTISERASQFNFHGYCVLKSIEHAIETKMHGSDVTGEFPDDSELNHSFVCDGLPQSRFVLH